MSDLTCPYCDKDREACSDDNTPDKAYERDCPHCEKTFVYFIEWSPSYSERKADCLNGAEHNWRDINKFGTEHYYSMRRRCRDCEKEEYTLKEKP